jgi:hypothetical protein
MDPVVVLKTIWQHRIVSIPILLLTVFAGVYVFQFAPRSYESSATYAMINPDIPTQLDRIKNPELENLNKKNPYLRSSDPSLIVQVLLTRLNDSSMADKLLKQGLSPDYTVSRGVGGINGFLVDITGIGDTPEKSFATTRALGSLLEKYLYDAQKVNGADDVYLFSSIVVTSPDKATEQFSSRLRALIVVFLAGVVLMFGAVSIARSQAAARDRRMALTGETTKGKVARTRRKRNSGEAPDVQLESVSETSELNHDSAGTDADGSDDGRRLPELSR